MKYRIGFLASYVSSRSTSMNRRTVFLLVFVSGKHGKDNTCEIEWDLYVFPDVFILVTVVEWIKLTITLIEIGWINKMLLPAQMSRFISPQCSYDNYLSVFPTRLFILHLIMRLPYSPMLCSGINLSDKTAYHIISWASSPSLHIILFYCNLLIIFLKTIIPDLRIKIYYHHIKMKLLVSWWSP